MNNKDNLQKPLPKIGDHYKHNNGVDYQVINIANIHSTNNKYPITIIYKGGNGRVWSKSITSWNETMTSLKDIIIDAFLRNGCSFGFMSPSKNAVYTRGDKLFIYDNKVSSVFICLGDGSNGSLHYPNSKEELEDILKKHT